MAEGWLRSLAGDLFDVCSAGTKPVGVHPRAVEVMKEAGVDLSLATSKSVEQLLGRHFGYVITVCDNAREHCPIFPGNSIRLHWSFQDPAAATGSDTERLEIFHKVRDEIRNRVEQFVSENSTRSA